jgi:hypothetical protein
MITSCAAMGGATELATRCESLTDRPEDYGMVSPEPNVPARAKYERWGWRQVASPLPGSGLRLWHTLALSLRAGQ